MGILCKIAFSNSIYDIEVCKDRGVLFTTLGDVAEYCEEEKRSIEKQSL